MTDPEQLKSRRSASFPRHVGREVLAAYVTEKAHDPGLRTQVIEQTWASLPQADRNNLAVVTKNAYPDNVEARQKLTQAMLEYFYLQQRTGEVTRLHELFAAGDYPLPSSAEEIPAATSGDGA